MARLPFAIAGILSVIAMYALARRLFGETSGAGRSRTARAERISDRIQPHRAISEHRHDGNHHGNPLFCPVHAARPATGYQILGAVFVATGLLAHYDAVFMLPTIAYLYATTTGGIRGWLRHWRSLLIALLVGVGMAGFVLRPVSAACLPRPDIRLSGISLWRKSVLQ